ncbi:PilW family protein [Massilia cavernae]|nr:PilW family protein [Massilia cavernae]
MNPNRPILLHAQRGFSLSELMVAAAISLVILAGMSTLFVNNNRAQAELEKANRQVENGRFAIQSLVSDLRNAGFYGEFDPTVLAAPAAVPDACALTVAAHAGALPLALQGVDDAAAGALACIPDLLARTDIIVVRRTATCVAGSAGCAPVSDGGPFFQASLCTNASELNSGDSANFYRLGIDTSGLDRHRRDCSAAAGSGTLAPVRRYLTHIYFIARNDRPADGVPTLKRLELVMDGSALAHKLVPLVNGIENLQAEYGIDTGNDGVADLFSANPASASGCADAACAVANWRNVVSLKLNLLARNIEPTIGHKDAKRYVLGLDAAGAEKVVEASGDAYKRHVFQTLVALPNLAGRKTP